MPKRYTYATTIGANDEIEAKVSFTVEWGSEPSGQFGRPEDYDPGAGHQIEDVRLESAAGLLTMTTTEILAEFEAKHLDAMLQAASVEAADDHHAALEYQAEARREDALLDGRG